jgi:hypothetical protein
MPKASLLQTPPPAGAFSSKPSTLRRGGARARDGEAPLPNACVLAFVRLAYCQGFTPMLPDWVALGCLCNTTSTTEKKKPSPSLLPSLPPFLLRVDPPSGFGHSIGLIIPQPPHPQAMTQAQTQRKEKESWRREPRKRRQVLPAGQAV